MTEYEINKAVAHIVLGEGNYDWCPHTKLVKKYVSEDKGLCVDFDPCNNAQQAWDIMLANDISVTQCLRGDDYCAYRSLWGEGESFNPEHLTCNSEFFFNSKPFVAAMLLFLEI